MHGLEIVNCTGYFGACLCSDHHFYLLQYNSNVTITIVSAHLALISRVAITGRQDSSFVLCSLTV